MFSRFRCQISTCSFANDQGGKRLSTSGTSPTSAPGFLLSVADVQEVMTHNQIQSQLKGSHCAPIPRLCKEEGCTITRHLPSVVKVDFDRFSEVLALSAPSRCSLHR